ncbi:LacI family DNA-binding transcriptional regulator [Frigoribacterium sp. PhB116]|uniref:LacI family DNA-binding transcriptional regulator n=1 Tax=Frigoribacterium sp. PhB116 TaxID=2485174 RepID=UPI001060175E|nr:LacI family DNA-binding transcriptional regulator [Frigoribacterium sp. PhB116]TDT66402.1 LacI family transcriptional regulator [Frigoribacterium sp. PhB116]
MTTSETRWAVPSVESPRLPTVVDVAKEAGVSRQTVSNVLNTPDIVAPATRSRVEQAIASLAYRPHASARRLRTRKSSTIGVRLDPVANGISGAVLDRFLHALTERADEHGLRVLLFTAKDPLDEVAQFRRLLDGADVDSFVLTSTSYDDPRTDWLLRAEADFVSFGRPWGSDVADPARRWVDVDGHQGVAEATRALLDGGARRVVFLGWPSASGIGTERRQGWRDTMLAHGVLAPAELDEVDLTVDDQVSLASDRIGELAAHLAETGRTIDAVVCASDSLALGAFMVLGRSVPVVGYDDTPVAAALGLSSVHQPVEEVAHATLDLLLHQGPAARVASPGSAADPRHRLLAPRLVLR